MSVPFAPKPGISGIFGRMESAPRLVQTFVLDTAFTSGATGEDTGWEREEEVHYEHDEEGLFGG